MKMEQKQRSDGIQCNGTEENILSSYFSFLINLQILNGNNPVPLRRSARVEVELRCLGH